MQHFQNGFMHTSEIMQRFLEQIINMIVLDLFITALSNDTIL